MEGNPLMHALKELTYRCEAWKVAGFWSSERIHSVMLRLALSHLGNPSIDSLGRPEVSIRSPPLPWPNFSNRGPVLPERMKLIVESTALRKGRVTTGSNVFMKRNLRR